jgi:nitrilase
LGDIDRVVVDLPFGRVGALSCWEHIQPLLKYFMISQREDIQPRKYVSLRIVGMGGTDLPSADIDQRSVFPV